MCTRSRGRMVTVGAGRAHRNRPACRLTHGRSTSSPSSRGSTDRQIADALYISKKTVSVHVSNILRKLDVANRIEAAEIGQHAGLRERDATSSN